MIEVICNDRLGKKVRVKAKYVWHGRRRRRRSSSSSTTDGRDVGGAARRAHSPDDTIGDFKKLVAAQTGTAPEKIVLKKWYALPSSARLSLAPRALALENAFDAGKCTVGCRAKLTLELLLRDGFSVDTGTPSSRTTLRSQTVRWLITWCR